MIQTLQLALKCSRTQRCLTDDWHNIDHQIFFNYSFNDRKYTFLNVEYVCSWLNYILETLSVSTAPTGPYEIPYQDTGLDLDGRNVLRFRVQGDNDAYLAFTTEPYQSKL